jgi:2-amino-4-hydroxy-6-hydroxymethyldihydropteridine diphosphokinase
MHIVRCVRDQNSCSGQSVPLLYMNVTKTHATVTENRHRMIILALGSNVAGHWGSPRETLQHAIRQLDKTPLTVTSLSHWYISAPVGQVRQPPFLNLTLTLEAQISARKLLILAKRLESAAGRSPGVRWGPRPLDVDIVDFRGKIVGWPLPRSPRRGLVLPHPEAHCRGFVLQPIADIAPKWRHPVFGLTVGELLRRRPELTKRLTRILDSP